VQLTHWRTVRLLLSYLGLFLNIPFAIAGIPQFKDITDWMRGVKESTLVREYAFFPTGKIYIQNGRGDIKIKGWSLPKIALQAVIRSSVPTQWLLDLEYYENELHINTTLAPSTIISVDLQLMVPHASSLTIQAQEGNIALKKLESPMHIVAHSGAISIKNSSESIKAYASEEVYVQFDIVPVHCVCELSSANDAIRLSLPQSSHANIQATTTTNAIYCDHFITLSPRTLRLNKHTWKEMQRNIHALIGNGGATIKLSAYKGVHITY
jgi:hypothetical protein